jgi:hypothetical protein
VLFLKNVFNVSEYCPALWETVSLGVPNLNFRDFGFFNVDLKLQIVLPLDALRQANASGSDIDMFNRSSTSTNVTLDFSTVIR